MEDVLLSRLHVSLSVEGVHIYGRLRPLFLRNIER